MHTRFARRRTALLASVALGTSAFGTSMVGTSPLAAQQPSTVQIGTWGAGGPREFRVDAGHSLVEFSVGFLGGRVKGRFDDLRGAVLVDRTNPARSSVTVVIDAGSLNTGSKHRDEHLRSEDFFDVARFPRIVFQSTRVEARPGRRGEYLIRGTLTLRGVTRDVVLPTRLAHESEDPHGTTLVRFASALRLARKDFGILGGAAHNDWFDAARSATMSDSVDVALELEGWDPDYARSTDDGLKRDVAQMEQAGGAATAARVRAAAAASPERFANGEWDFDQRARALLVRGRTADALELFKLAAELYPKSAAARTSLGYAYERAGDGSAARAQYDTALALDPYLPRALELKRRLR